MEEEVLEKTGFVFEIYHVEWKHSPHSHDHYELFYQLNGVSSQKIDNCVYNVDKGDFILIPPNVVHETNVNGTRILLQISKKFLNKYFTPKSIEILMGVFAHTHIRPEKEAQEQIQSLFNSMKDIYVSDDERIFELFAYLMKYLSDAPVINKIETDISNRIKSICTYIDSNYAEISGIKSVAKEFYISEAYLCRSFKKVMGIPFSQYLTKTKLNNATKLLINEKENISKIAEKCGFHSLAYFCNVFRKEYGISPYRYKQGFPLK